MSKIPAAMLPHQIQREVSLVQSGRCVTAIVYPHDDPAFASLASRLAETISLYASESPEVIADDRIIPFKGTPLPEPFRNRPLILLGNLNNNRLVLPLYARYYCATDAVYPGGGGFDLRTLVNPYGTGTNLLLVGGSHLEGVVKAANRLTDHINHAGRRGEIKLPYLMEVELERSLAHLLSEWPDALLENPPPANADLPMYRAIGAYALVYAWTGDKRYGIYARNCLLKLNSLVEDSYGDRHYYLERLVRAILILLAGGLLETADLLRTDQLLLNTALGMQDMWWRKRDAEPPLGHRHHGKGTYEFFLIAHYLRWQAKPNPTARELCDRWLMESRAYLDGLARAGFDDQDDDTTLNNIATLFWYALGEERSEFFENGNARRAAERAIALHDNMGAGAGQSGYTEAYLNMLYCQMEATIPVAAAAFYYQDGSLKWILKNLPNLDLPITGGRGLYYYPIFMHKFDTGKELPPEPPDAIRKLRVLPLTPYQVTINNDPPIHIEPLGHLVNAPETWLLPEGVTRNYLAAENGFDKIVARRGYEPDDPYLLLQGYQGGFRWQGRNRGANCIVRFSQFGHIFLVQNTRHLSPYFLNGVYASDGYNLDPVPPIAEWLAVCDFPSIGLSSTRLSNYHNTEWTRHILWHKAGQGFFVVIDCLRAMSDGPFSYTCTWRSPGYAVLEGYTWHSNQGSHRFSLCTSEDLSTFTEIEEGQNAAAPFILHQVKSGMYSTGTVTSFQNLFYALPEVEFRPIDLRRIDESSVIVCGLQPIGYFAASPDVKELEANGVTFQSTSAWISPEEICLSGATQLAIAGLDMQLESRLPIGIYLDLQSGRLLLQPATPGSSPRAIRGVICGQSVQVELIPGEFASFNLPEDNCRRFAMGLTDWLTSQASGSAPLPHSGFVKPQGWREGWHFSGWKKVPEQLRTVTVEAEPAPIDGFPEQLCDTIYPELRDARQQWPEASQYRITLNLAETRELSRLRLVGDSFTEPFFKVFNPLPDGIRVEVEDGSEEGLSTNLNAPPVPGEAIQQRFRGFEDRLQALDYPLDCSVRRIRLTIPAPSPGHLLVLNEVELYTSEKVNPGVRFLLPFELGGGRTGVVAVTRSHELVVLGPEGDERWRKQISSPVTHLSCLRLDSLEQPASLCLGLLNGDVEIYSTGGDLRQQIHLRAEMDSRRDVFFGWLDCPNEIQVWQRDAAGRAALAVGGYGIVVFLNPDGEVVGHSFADGPWVYSLLAVSDRFASDLWARTGWNHGIMVYEGREGFTPSGESVAFGGVRQPMYRALKKVIPFVNGKTLQFERAAVGPNSETLIAAAAQEGFGVLSTDQRDWLWKVEGGTPVTACQVVSPEASQPELVTGGADGFICSFSLVDGHPKRRFFAGAPITGLIWMPDSGMMAAATRSGIMALGPGWKVQAFYPLEVTHLCQVGERSILAADNNGRLVQLRLEGD